MEFPEERYYRLNRILLSTIGLWPYDNFKLRRLRSILSLLIIMSLPSTQWIKLYISESSFDLLLKILSYNIILTMSCTKYITFYAVYENSIKEFREHVRNNWNGLKDNQEIKIMCKQKHNGKLITISMAMIGYIISLFYLFTQYISILLDIVAPLNVSRPREFLILSEYFIDHEKYFYIITVYIAIGVFIVMTCFIATESFSLIFALHAFGLFKIASYRMKHILSGINPHMCLTKKYAISHNRIIDAVDFHRRAIEFSELFKASFGQAYLILFIMCVCSASVNLLNLSRILMTEKEILEIIKSVFLISLHVIYLTIANYVGQEFINSDTHFYRIICNVEWYNTPLKTQRLIFFLIQKTTKCYKIDAGGMFNPCLEGLATSFSMSISYFMVLYSM